MTGPFFFIRTSPLGGAFIFSDLNNVFVVRVE